MTPKEKASSLFSYFYNQCFNAEKDREHNISTAIECAIMVADEMLDILNAGHWGLEIDKAFDYQHYWTQVKDELLKKR